MTNIYAAVATFVAIVAAFAISGMIILAPTPAASAEEPNRLDLAAFAYWEHQMAEATEVDALQVIDRQAPRGDRPHILPPVPEWDGSIRVCDADHNPPEGWTRFGGFCQQIAYPDRQSLMFQGTDAIFGFKGK